MNRDGSRYPWILREVEVNIRDFNKCRKNHHANLQKKKYFNLYVKPGQNFCAGDGERDSCLVSLHTVQNSIFFVKKFNFRKKISLNFGTFQNWMMIQKMDLLHICCDCSISYKYKC